MSILDVMMPWTGISRGASKAIDWMKRSQSILRTGVVLDNVDPNRSGAIKVKPDGTDQGDGTDNGVWMSMASPVLGPEYGFMHVPGPGAIVLYADVHALGLFNVPHKYIWFSCIGTPVLETIGRNVYGSDADYPDDYDNTQIDLEGAPPESKGLRFKANCPNSSIMYGDNDTPQAAIWKSPRGDFFQFTWKITECGTHDTASMIMNASGKYIRIDDGPAEKGMDRITICDENNGEDWAGNKIEILTGDADKPNSILVNTKQDQDYVTHEGAQVMSVLGGEGVQMRETLSPGGIEDVSYITHHGTTAETDIIRTSNTGNITETCKLGNISYTANAGKIDIQAPLGINITCGTSTIQILPGVINITAPLITINGIATLTGVAGTLNTHTHTGNLGIPTPIVTG